MIVPQCLSALSYLLLQLTTCGLQQRPVQQPWKEEEEEEEEDEKEKEMEECLPDT